MKREWYEYHHRERHKEYLRSEKSGGFASVIAASLALATPVLVLVTSFSGCGGGHNDQIQQQAAAQPQPAPNPPIPAPTAPPAPVIPPEAQIVPPSSDVDLPSENALLPLVRVPGLDAALKTYRGVLTIEDPHYPYRDISQKFTLTLAKQTVSPDVVYLYAYFYSNGELGEIRFSRYLDRVAKRGFYFYDERGPRRIKFRTHEAYIPAILNSKISSFALELTVSLRQGRLVDPARSSITILDCGSFRCSAELVPAGT